MYRLKKIIFLLALSTCMMTIHAQTIEDGLKTINESTLKAQLNILASDWMEGREAGTKGEFMASDYIASMFQVYGIQPFGDTEYRLPTRSERSKGFKPESYKTYFQKFNIVKYKLTDNQQLDLIHEENGSRSELSFEYGIDYSVSNIKTNFALTAPVVFVGYGINDRKSGYNDYSKVDVKGKIIVRLNGFPGYLDTVSVAYKKVKIDNIWDKKDQWASEAGALAVINISQFPEKQLSKPSNLPYYFKQGNFESNVQPAMFYDTWAYFVGDSLDNKLPQIRLSARVQNELLKIAAIDIAGFEQRVKGTLKPESKEIANTKIGLKVNVKSELVGVRNVLGYIEGEKKDEFIVIGAHYDHLGNYNGYIYNGADDNGSGAVGVLAIARAMQESGVKPQKSIIFAAWTAEERGLFGSQYFVKNNPSIRKILFNMNMDMIARNSENDSLGNKCTFGYTMKYEGLHDLAQSKIAEYDLDLNLQYNPSVKPMGGSDFSSFSESGLPIVSFFAAMHSDYHQPSDELDKINWKKMEQIVKLGYTITYDLSNNGLQKYRYEKKTEESGK